MKIERVAAIALIASLPPLAQWATSKLIDVGGVTAAQTYISYLVWLPLAWLISKINRPSNRVIAALIIIFPIFGNINAVASVAKYGKYYTSNLDLANTYYSILAFSYILGMLLHQAFKENSKRVPRGHTSHPELDSYKEIFPFIFALFPVFWIVNQVSAVGLPILSGRSIVDDMYQSGYGSLYGLGLWVVCAAIYALGVLRETTSTKKKLAVAAYIIMLCFFMVFDGRRVFIIVFIFSCLFLFIEVMPPRRLGVFFASASLAIIGIYFVVLIARQGGILSTKSNGLINALTVIGVEYRDYSFVLTRFGRDGIRDYDWLGSALGAFLNSTFLSIFGIQKGNLVFSGSAYTIASELRSNFGIRIGLLPELQMAYGLFASIPALLIGYLHAKVSYSIATRETLFGATIMACICAILTLAFVGQTTVTTGYLSLLLYLVGGWALFRHLGKLYRMPHRALSSSAPATHTVTILPSNSQIEHD